MCNLLASETNKNVEFLEEALGFKVRERILAEDKTDVAAWLSVSSLVHDVAIMGDALARKRSSSPSLLLVWLSTTFIRCFRPTN